MNKMRRVITEDEQQGFVAIVVAAMLIVLMALITIGFTRLIQRDQRQVLDRQLSQQALYAAESGINDVYTLLQNTTAPAEKTTCDVFGMPRGGVIDDEAGVSYTCVLYDRSPNELTYSVATDESELVRLTSNGGDFDAFRFSWGIEGGVNNVGSLPDCADAGDFVSSRSVVTPLLRVDLTKLTALDRASLISATDSMYLAPCQDSSGSSATHTYANSKGVVIPVWCDSNPSLTQPCSVTIEGLGGADFLARIRAVYEPAYVTVSGTNASGDTLSMIGGQTVIDVTGRAQDVTRRLRVTVPEADVTGIPDGVAQIYNGFCKLLEVEGSSVTDGC